MQPWLLEIAIEPKSKADRENLVAALAQLAAEDSLFGVRTDREAGQIIVTSMGELHLDDKVDIIRRIHKVDANFGRPQVAYHERTTNQATVDYTHKQQIGGSGRYARVKIACEPLPPGTGFIFENKIVGGAVPQEYLPAVEKGIESVLCSGVLAGFPVVDLKVTLIDGAYHDTDTTAVAFENAARMALREALQKSGAVLLEPIMKVEVVTPQDYSSAVVDDFTARRGQIQS
jgi:elongation factor G